MIAPGNRPVWSTRTEGNRAATLRMQNDGNVVVYAQGNRAIWASKQPALGQRIADVARAEANNAQRNVERGANCNFYSGALGAGSPCANGWRAQAWCADFARWVWAQAGARTAGLNSGAASFAQFGRNNGTWRAGSSAVNARVGDAAVYHLNSAGTWSSHVALVVAVHGNGTIDLIGGNTSNKVLLLQKINPAAAGISGYASPVR